MRNSHKWLLALLSSYKGSRHSLLLARAVSNTSRQNLKRDTFSVAKLRTIVKMATGRQHDSEICRLLNVASRAAGFSADDWKVGTLQKAAIRFKTEYKNEEVFTVQLALAHIRYQLDREHAYTAIPTFCRAPTSVSILFQSVSLHSCHNCAYFCIVFGCAFPRRYGTHCYMYLPYYRGVSRQCSLDTTLAELLTALEAKPCGAGYKGKCPAHTDENASLSIKETEAGKILFHCFSGCSQKDVLDALRDIELWPLARSQRGSRQ